MDLEKWLADWTACVDGIFGERIRFLGIQGSYGRGEATAESDIDVVLLLDGLQLEDLQAYDEAVSALPMREKRCGFVGGWEELIHWDKADLFQFIQDTRALRGSLDDLWREITKKDIQRTAQQMGKSPKNMAPGASSASARPIQKGITSRKRMP